MLHHIREWRGNVYRASQGDDFFQSPEWLALRKDVFWRDRQRCVRCDKRFKLSNLTCHHMIPRAEGGADDIHNLVTLCNPCHDFAEINNLRTRADIAGSYGTEGNDDAPAPEARDDDDPYRRPRWHKWVYGGQKNLRRP